MPFNIIEKIRNAGVSERASIIKSQYEKNRAFFRKNFPEVDKFLNRTICPYRIDITAKFLDIVHDATGKRAHPEAGIDRLSEMLALPDNGVWTDLHEFITYLPRKSYQHCALLRQFNRQLLEIMPDLAARVNAGKVVCPVCVSGKIYSPPVIFLGVFHGLHIASYMARNEVSQVMLVEPEPERFMVSCYFLDYQALYESVARMLIVFDEAEYDSMFQAFFAWHKVSPQVWTRVLPGYASSCMGPTLQRIEAAHAVHLRNIRPFDVELKGLLNCARNLRRGLKILERAVELSSSATILVAGSGPSLEYDMKWIRDNQERMIIFAVHSAVKALVNSGIEPDFQFSVDIHLDNTIVQRLGLLRKKPLVTTCKVNKELVDVVDRVFLVEAENKVHPVKFSMFLQHIYPTTGNLAVAFAAFLKPARLILAGMDMGFRDNEKQHVSGGFFGEGSSSMNHDIFQVPPNFDDGNKVLTNGLYNKGRLEIESVLEKLTECEVFNISDGARIKGAKAVNSEELMLSGYNEKEEDIATAISAFGSAKRGINWEQYSLSGKELIRQFKEISIKELGHPNRDMDIVSRRLDLFLEHIVRKMKNREGGQRVELFLKLLLDASAIFYRFLLFSKNDRERIDVYRKALNGFRDLINALEWPDELDKPDL